MGSYVITGCFILALACTNIQQPGNKDTAAPVVFAAMPTNMVRANPPQHSNYPEPRQIVAYAKTLTGTPYQYASANPSTGLDCSGFITYVFNHFGIEVPRSSVNFTDAYPEVSTAGAQPGDLILFTGTDSTKKVVGHMGIVVFNNGDSMAFIHSTSGKANGVTITPLNAYYKSRFVKIVRALPQPNGLQQ